MEANLRHAGFRARFLDDDTVEYGWSILQSGSPLERAVLEWSLDNLGPLRAFQERPEKWMVLSYEELMLSTQRLIPLLARRLKLNDHKRMLRVLRTPSPSTHGKSHDKVRTLKPVQQLALWQQEVDHDAEARLFEIVHRFGIDIYEPGAMIPTRRYRNLA